MIHIQEIITVLEKDNLLLGYANLAPDLEVTGKPTTNSALVSPGDIFIAISGFTIDGHKFALDANHKGACAVIHEKPVDASIPSIRVKDTRKAAALVAKLYYHDPTSGFKLIGVTGTNGKTTVTTLINQLLIAMGKPTGLIGTLGYEIKGEHFPTERTTPDIMELNQIFSDMAIAGCEYVIMEVSSHALTLDRVYGCEFDYALFTNLSRDHLDFHGDMDSYAAAKNMLFEYTIRNNGHALINIDDEYGCSINQRFSANCTSISFVKGDITIGNLEQDFRKSSFILQTGSFNVEVNSSLLGRFNVMNVAMAVSAVIELLPQADLSEITQIIPTLKPPAGRLEPVPNHKNIGVFVDYAHTPDALENVLKTMRELNPGRLLCLVGAGGDRDRGKRSEMGKTAVKWADLSIFTNDNPRSESPTQIIREIVADLDPLETFWVIRDRKIAIETLIHNARANDIVLIAGKGHETYQEINGTRHHFDDSEVASKAVADEYLQADDELALPVDPLMLDILYGKHHEKEYSDEVYTTVSTDSRSIGSNALFFAITGENFNGHDFVPAVLSDPDRFAIVSQNTLQSDNLIIVEDTVSALGLFARKYLSLFLVKRIALTGSVGKTTTKEFIYNVVCQDGDTLKTQANENNYIGLPKTIFRIRPEHKYAVLELGTNHFGEIKQLADICQPQIAIITNIGPSHLEFFENEDGVYREKTELFNRPLEALIFPGDDPRFISYKTKGLSFGLNPGNTYHIGQVSVDGLDLHFQINEEKYRIHSQIPYYAVNAAIAVVVGKCLGFTTSTIQKGLAEEAELGYRMKIKESGKRTLIIDCYNANPVSMKAALDYWLQYEPQRPHIAIIGDMLELGDKADDYHKEIGNYLHQNGVKEVMAVGEKAGFFEGKYHYINVDEVLASGIMNQLETDAVILLKASHGMHLEKLIGRL